MSNIENQHSDVGPNVIQQCINDMEKVKDLYNALQGRYEQLEKRHFKLLNKHEELKHFIGKFSTDLKEARKSKDSQLSDELLNRITDACEGVIKDHDWEQKLAYDALLMYHNGVNKALLFGVGEVMDGGSSGHVYLSIKEKLQESCKDVSDIINIGTLSSFGYGVAKEIAKDSGNDETKEQKQEDNDEAMSQT